MLTQERKLAKNYIGILSETSEEQPTLEALPRSDRLMKSYFLDLIAAVLKRHRGAK